VDRWRTERSIDRTLTYRPELLAGAVLDKKAKKYYNEALAAQKRADDEVSKNEK
jgi:tRNA G37 N-methylase TrmD